MTKEQKFEFELEQKQADIINLLCEMFHWTPKLLLKLIVRKEVEWVKHCLKQNSLEFLGEYFENSEVESKMKQLLEINKESEPFFTLPSDILKQFTTLCEVNKCSIHDKLVAIIQEAILSAELVYNGDHKLIEVSNF